MGEPTSDPGDTRCPHRTRLGRQRWHGLKSAAGHVRHRLIFGNPPLTAPQPHRSLHAPNNDDAPDRKGRFPASAEDDPGRLIYSPVEGTIECTK